MRALAILLALASAAHAEDRAAAKRYFHAGELAYQAQNFAAAAQDFDDAYAAAPLPEIAFSAAQAYRRQYRVDPKVEYVDRAVTLYRQYLDAVKTGGRVADAADALGDMQRELDKLIRAGAKVSPKLAAEHTQLGISIVIGGAAGAFREVSEDARGAGPKLRVTLDGKEVTPYEPINVAPGAHAIHVEADGYQPVERTETAVQGTSYMVELQLLPLPALLAIATEAGARIVVDGRPSGIAPVDPVPVPAGKHVVTITRRGREGVARELDATNGQHIAIDERLVQTTQRRAVPWVVRGGAVLGGLALVALGLDLYEQHVAIDARDKLATGNAPPSELERYDTARSRRDAFGEAAWVFVGAGLATVAVAGALYYFDTPLPDGVRPLVTPHGVGVGVAARF